MKYPKILTFIAFILNSLLTVYYGNVFFNKLLPIYQEFGIEKPFLKSWPLLISAVFAIGSFIYWLYLKNKEQRGETVKFALWLSIALLLIFFILSFLIGILIVLPLYNLIGVIE